MQRWIRLQVWVAQRCPREGQFLPATLPCQRSTASPLGLPLLMNTGWLPATCGPCASSLGCFCSAFQAKIPRFTPIKFPLDISLLQHLHLISQRMLGSAFKIHAACNHLTPRLLLPPCNQPSAFHLDYRSHLPTGLPASAPVPPTAA